MENKNIIIAVAIIVIIAILGVIFATGILNGNDKSNVETTPFNSTFMEGSFVGNTKLAEDNVYMQSYEDKENKITYNISTVDDSDSLMDIYYLQGISNPEQRTLNRNDWNIYFAQAVSGDGNQSSSEAMNIIICQSQSEKQGYLIYVIFAADSKVNFTLNTYGDAYIDFIEPLLESVTLKETSNVPKIYDELGVSESEFNQQMDLIKQYKAGNTSVLEGTG